MSLLLFVAAALCALLGAPTVGWVLLGIGVFFLLVEVGAS